MVGLDNDCADRLFDNGCSSNPCIRSPTENGFWQQRKCPIRLRDTRDPELIGPNPELPSVYRSAFSGVSAWYSCRSYHVFTVHWQSSRGLGRGVQPGTLNGRTILVEKRKVGCQSSTLDPSWEPPSSNICSFHTGYNQREKVLYLANIENCRPCRDGNLESAWPRLATQ